MEKLQPLIKLINSKDGNIIVGIDGHLASGKTTAAKELAGLFDLNVIHMDNFFLPPPLRTEKRLSEPGGNIHYERFCGEVINSLCSGEKFSYRKFDCSLCDYAETIEIHPKRITVIEGSYSLHPLFRHIYNITVFCEINPEEQLKRILHRNGEKTYQLFKDKWIPLENYYFDYYKIRETCQIII